MKRLIPILSLLFLLLEAIVSPQCTLCHVPPLMVGLKRHSVFNYYGEIMLGIPAQKLEVLFTSNGEESWVLSSDCMDEFCLNRQRYDPSLSRTSSFTEPSRRRMHYLYYMSEMKITTIPFVDQLVIGGKVLKRVELSSAKNVYLCSYVRHLALMRFQGIIGLDGHTAPGFVHQLFDHDFISKEIFSIHLNRDINSQTGQREGESNTTWAGHLILGAIDESFYEGPMNYFARNATVVVNLDDLPRNLNRTRSYPKYRFSKAVIEMSVNILAAKSDIVEEMAYSLGAFKSAGNSALYRFAGCSLDKLPDFKIEINNKNYTLLPAEYILKETIGRETICYLGIAIIYTQRSDLYLGASFIQKYYTVVDMEQSRYGLAKSVDANESRFV